MCVCVCERERGERESGIRRENNSNELKSSKRALLQGGRRTQDAVHPAGSHSCSKECKQL